jgi:mono/diheme cytochrome c family protein
MRQRLLLLSLVLVTSLMSGCQCEPTEQPDIEKPADTMMPQDETHINMSQFQTFEDVKNSKKMSPIQKKALKDIEQKVEAFTQKPNELPEVKGLYLAHCARCHGQEGFGDGPEEDNLGIAPTNFREWDFKYTNELAQIVFSITFGRGEGEMPGFGNTLAEDEIWALAYMVQEWSQSQPSANGNDAAKTQ